MNVLVTGGAGFIGSNIVDAYVGAGHHVVVVDDLSSGRRVQIHPAATFYELDIRNEAIEQIFEREQIEVVNHHAAQMDVRKSVSDPAFDASVNILGLLNILERGRRCGVRKVIFSSTGGAIYGEQDTFPAGEEHPMRPLSPYGVSKLASEKYLYYYREIHKLETVILRYANVYGPRQNPHGEAGVVAIFASKMLSGGQPVINGDGLQTRDYVFVGDVVQANLLALAHGASDVFNIGTGIESDVNTLFRHLRKLTGSPCTERHAPPKAGEQKRSVIDASKARRMLGWQPTVGLEDGLAKTVEYFKNNPQPRRT